MIYTIQNRKNIQGRSQRGLKCYDGESNQDTYWFDFIDGNKTNWGIELERKMTDDGFIKYKLFSHFGAWVLDHTRMIKLYDIKTPDNAMDLFTQIIYFHSIKK